MADLRLNSDNSLDTIYVATRLSTTCGVTIGTAPIPGANTQARGKWEATEGTASASISLNPGRSGGTSCGIVEIGTTSSTS
jgi:hypothetical protein